MSSTRGVRRLARLALCLGILLITLAPAVAWAQTGGGNSDYPVVSTSTTQPCTYCTTSTVIQVKGESTLPFTGGDVALVTVLGLAAAASGVFLVWLGRRSTTAS